MRTEPTEAQTQRAILDWLAAERIWHVRLNVGAMSGQHKGKKWFVRFGRPGMADILAIKRVKHGVQLELQPIWIEVKGPKGKQSDEQFLFQTDVEMNGHRYILAYSVDDAIREIQEV